MATKKKKPSEGLFGDIEHAAEKVVTPQAIEGLVGPEEAPIGLAQNVANQWTPEGKPALKEVGKGLKALDQASGDSKKKKKPDAGGTGKTGKQTQAEIDAEAEKALENNPITIAGNQLAQADQAGAQQAEQAMGAGPGSLLANVSGQSQAQALADAGVSPGSSAGAWLSSNLAQANANDSPLMNAMNAYQAAYEQTQPAVNQALTNMGQANAIALAEDPYQDYLNLLTSHLGNTNYLQLTGPQASTVASNPNLSYYLQQAGVSVPNSKTTAGIPSAGAILSGGTSTAPTPSALTPGAGPAPS